MRIAGDSLAQSAPLYSIARILEISIITSLLFSTHLFFTSAVAALQLCVMQPCNVHPWLSIFDRRMSWHSQ